MKYTLKSGLASYEGTPMGAKEYIFPINKKGVETALKEALEELAELQEKIKTAGVDALSEEASRLEHAENCGF